MPTLDVWDCFSRGTRSAISIRRKETGRLLPAALVAVVSSRKTEAEAERETDKMEREIFQIYLIFFAVMRPWLIEKTGSRPDSASAINGLYVHVIPLIFLFFKYSDFISCYCWCDFNRSLGTDCRLTVLDLTQ